jgi:hypothetical protein
MSFGVWLREKIPDVDVHLGRPVRRFRDRLMIGLDRNHSRIGQPRIRAIRLHDLAKEPGSIGFLQDERLRYRARSRRPDTNDSGPGGEDHFVAARPMLPTPGNNPQDISSDCEIGPGVRRGQKRHFSDSLQKA